MISTVTYTIRNSFLNSEDCKESLRYRLQCQLLSVNQIQRNRVIEIPVVPVQSETLINLDFTNLSFEKARSQDTTVHGRVSAVVRHL